MKRENRDTFHALTMILHLGITMMVPIFLCLVVGIWLARLFSADWLVLLFLLLGILAGFRNAYYVVSAFFPKKTSEEEYLVPHLDEHVRRTGSDEMFSSDKISAAGGTSAEERQDLCGSGENDSVPNRGG